MGASLTLFKNDSLVGKAGAPITFAYTALWDSIEGQNYAPVINGGSIKIHGRGFALESTGIRYALKFTGRIPVNQSLPFQYSEDGQRLGDSISFILPDWIYPEQFTTISVHRSIGGDILSVVPYAGIESGSIFEWHSVWQSARLLYTYEMPQPAATAPSVGGSSITLYGSGLARSPSPDLLAGSHVKILTAPHSFWTLGQPCSLQRSSHALLRDGLNLLQTSQGL